MLMLIVLQIDQIQELLPRKPVWDSNVDYKLKLCFRAKLKILIISIRFGGRLLRDRGT